jgi:hypothetical protein
VQIRLSFNVYTVLQNASSELIRSIFLSLGYRLDKEEAGREARSVVYDQFVSADEASIRSQYFIRKTEIIGGLNYATKRHLELQTKTLQNAPRDLDKLERLLKAKRRQKEEAMHIEDTHKSLSQLQQ